MRFIIETKENVCQEDIDKVKYALLHMKFYGERDEHLENDYNFHLKDIIKSVKAEFELKHGE